MSVEEAIVELLKVHNRVILPNFGAFLVAKDDPEDKSYVLFNSFLSFNDGLLIDYLIEKNGVDNIVATDFVSEYVFKLKAILNEEKLYKFNYLGSFDFEESGSMRFRYNPNTGRTPQKPASHAKVAAKVVEKKEISKEPEEKVVQAPILSSPITTTSSAKEDKPKDNKSNDDLLNFDSSTPPTVVVEASPRNAGSGSNELSDAKFELIEEKPTLHKKSEPSDKPWEPVESNTKRTVIFIGLFAVTLAIIGYLFLVYFPNKQEEEMRKIAMEREAKSQVIFKKQQEDSIAIIKTRELAIADSIRISDESKVTMANGYHIIIGAFADERNADKLVAKLKSDNFPMAQKIVGKNRFLVSAESCSDVALATKRLQVVTQTLGADGWIYKVK